MMKLKSFLSVAFVCVLSCRLASAAASAYFLPVENSEGRSLRYWADHPLDQLDTKSEHAVLIVHGVNGGMKDGAATIRTMLASHRDTSKVFFVAPNIVVPELHDPIDKTKIVVSMTEEEKQKIVYWKRNTWQAGGDSPVASGFSSYDALDRIFAKLNDKAVFPALKTVLICGYSAGGQVLSRYVAFTRIRPREGLQLNFAAGAPSSWLYFFDKDAQWHYGLASRNRYTEKATEEEIMENLASRYCLCFCGTEDKQSKWLDERPAAMAQGLNRYERFLRFRDYIATFPRLKGHFRFVPVDGTGKEKPHGALYYENEAFINLVFGER